jgi:hypothetical protein
MGCLQCGKSLGLARRFKDKQFCSDEHRKNYRRDSARLVRESAALGEMEESWLVTSGDLTRRPAKTAAGGIVPMMLIAAVVVVLLVLAPKDGAPPPPRPVSYAPSVGSLGAKVMGSISKGTFYSRLDFQAAVDLTDWLGITGSGSIGSDVDGWITKSGSVYPGKLRLWQQTTLLSDYQLNFGAAIESKAMSWAYRATDPKNFYATKLILSDGNRTEISRWANVDGQSLSRVQLPLPISLMPGKDYQVQVRVLGNRFTTFVDNQLIDTWTDSKLPKGGVGFFSDAGERAAVRWVAINQQDSGGLGGIFKFGIYLPVIPVPMAMPSPAYAGLRTAGPMRP